MSSTLITPNLETVTGTGGASMILLGTQSASNTPTITFLAIPSIYQQLEFRLTAVGPASGNGNLNIGFSTSAVGGTWSTLQIATGVNPHTSNFGFSGVIYVAPFTNAPQISAFGISQGVGTVSTSAAASSLGGQAQSIQFTFTGATSNNIYGSFSLYGIRTS